jgi:tRNA 2-thiouridine synthesizing protein A
MPHSRLSQSIAVPTGGVTHSLVTTLWTDCNIALISCGMKHDDTVDTSGMLCPLPVLKARKRLQSLEVGQVLRVLADDPVAVIDIPNFCHESGHDLLSSEQSGREQVYLIRKGGL